MSQFSPSGSGLSRVTGSSNPLIQEVALPLANTEYTVVLPAGTTRYRLRTRDGSASFRVYFSSGGAEYQLIPRYCFYSDGGLTLAGATTLYIQSTVAGQTLECVSWL